MSNSDTQTEKRPMRPLGAVIALVGAGLIVAGVLGVQRGFSFLFGVYCIFGGIATYIYQTFVQE